MSRPVRWLSGGGLVLAAVFVVATLSAHRPAALAAPQSSATAIAPSRIDRPQLMQVVRALSAPGLEGRATGTDGGRVARRYIRNAFAEIGLSPFGADFLQPFSFVRSSDSRHKLPGTAQSSRYDDAANVVGGVDGTRTDARHIVISAHYDHLGRRNGILYPGADDNASGVAALLAIARYVRDHPLTHGVIFAAFDAEELGLEGAKAFLKAPPVSQSRLALNINFDMLSRNDRHEIFAAGTAHYPSLKPIVEEAQERARVTVRFGHDQAPMRGRMVDDWTMQSDHGVFHRAGIPFLYFGVEDHSDYHRPTDTADKIDPDFFGNVVEMLLDVVLAADRQVP